MKYQIIPHESYNLLRLRSDSGLEASFSEIGASIIEIRFAGAPMTIAPKDLNEFNGPNSGYFGKTAGRIAGRVPNSLLHFEGKDYSLEPNENRTSLHGGPHGLSTKRFALKVSEVPEGILAEFTYLSPAGEAGYPGALTIKVSYLAYAKKPALRLMYNVTTDADTPLNLTNHSYFNLGGFRHVGEMTLYLRAGNFFPVDAHMIPGKVTPVPPCLDFRHGKMIKDDLENPYLLNSQAHGYDHGFLFDVGPIEKHKAILSNDHYIMEIFTDYPCIQVYSDNYPRLNMPLTNGHKEGPHSGIALECVNIPGDYEGTQKVTPAKPYSRFVEYVFAKKEIHQ
jgi:Galactose mutarotase and related enzymes